MAANTTPIFLLTPVISWIPTGTAANTNLDGTGTLATAYTAAGTSGSKVNYLAVMPLGTNVQTVLRVFLNNGGANGTPANNSLIWEETMLANTLDQTTASIRHTIPLNIQLPPGYRIMVSIGTAVSAGLQVAAICGDY